MRSMHVSCSQTPHMSSSKAIQLSMLLVADWRALGVQGMDWTHIVMGGDFGIRDGKPETVTISEWSLIIQTKQLLRDQAAEFFTLLMCLSSYMRQANVMGSMPHHLSVPGRSLIVPLADFYCCNVISKLLNQCMFPCLSDSYHRHGRPKAFLPCVTRSSQITSCYLGLLVDRHYLLAYSFETHHGGVSSHCLLHPPCDLNRRCSLFSLEWCMCHMESSDCLPFLPFSSITDFVSL